MRKSLVLLLTAAIVMVSFGCASMTGKQEGAAIGTTTGAAIGGVIGHQTGNTALGAILGAAIGGAAGIYIGNYMDKQAAELEEELAGAQIERVAEGIKITFDSGLLFDVDKADLSFASRKQLSNFAETLSQYGDTNILLEGHTDSTGPDEYNLDLSVRRAQAVADYLTSLGVEAARLTIKGYGEVQPIADNTTVDGRQQNRRVEVAIYANDELKKTAQENSQG
ncbi:MAG TPA: OmpA family protein [bacterium]|jgi:outer membrane protein OmpA-like peptidoglycan-associated protein|nr:OmpA family protein [bacterium]HNT65893.1 OmpA family protein [bacterium]HOX86627.1 OmpA family protein [bacterium]HPG46183.1 OmpA family protein [bacterium]HPM98189.1 OmpA family protein [bacterium]